MIETILNTSQLTMLNTKSKTLLVDFVKVKKDSKNTFRHISVVKQDYW